MPDLPTIQAAVVSHNTPAYTELMLHSLFSCHPALPNLPARKSVLVPPEYWGSGVAILLFDEMVRRASGPGKLSATGFTGCQFSEQRYRYQ